MRVLVFSEFVRRMPWSSDAWVGDLVCGLCERGHEVTVACDGAEDASVFGPAQVLMRQPGRTHIGRRPLAFRRWAERVRGACPHDAVLSLTHLIGGDVWCPVGPSSWPEYRTVVLARPLASLAMEAAHRVWIGSAVVSERRASEEARRAGVRACVIGCGRAVPGARPLGYASRIGAGMADRPDLRAQMRSMLAIGPDRPVVLVSGVHPYRAGLSSMLEGLTRCCRGMGEGESPLLLVVGRNGHSVERAASRVGCGERVRLLGPTGRMDAAMAASDLVVSPSPGPGSGRTGRFVADALRCGRPVLMASTSPGASLLEAGRGDPGAGMLLKRTDADGWAEALRRGLDPGWRASAGAAAARLGGSLGLEELVGRLEGLLADASSGKGRRARTGPDSGR